MKRVAGVGYLLHGYCTGLHCVLQVSPPPTLRILLRDSRSHKTPWRYHNCNINQHILTFYFMMSPQAHKNQPRAGPVNSPETETASHKTPKTEQRNHRSSRFCFRAPQEYLYPCSLWYQQINSYSHLHVLSQNQPHSMFPLILLGPTRAPRRTRWGPRTAAWEPLHYRACSSASGLDGGMDKWESVSRRRRGGGGGEGERLQLSCMGCWCCCIGTAAPSLPRREWKKQGVVMWFPHKQEEKRTGEKGIAGRGGGGGWRGGGRFPAQYRLFSHFSMDAMYGIWSGLFRGSWREGGHSGKLNISSFYFSVFVVVVVVFVVFPATVHSAAVLGVPSL